MSAAVAISLISIGDRHRRHMGDLQAPANSIAEVGLRQPTSISPQGALVFGERRRAAERWCEVSA
jgi:ParB family chromosome partitioning protein